MTKARTKNLDLIKPKQTLNRVQKQKRERPARAHGTRSYAVLMKSREKEGVPLDSDDQPPFERLPVALLLNSSATFKCLVEAERQRLFDDRGDKVCYNSKITQLKKTHITEYTVYNDDLIEGIWAKKQMGYAELAALGKEVIWDLVVMWSNIVMGGSCFGQGKEDESLTDEDLVNFAILGKFLEVEEEFFERLRKAEHEKFQ
ncbi:uncharacterized protein EAF01_002271 [Botrytis porri]|uniref:uncharacterized protein n=1 Tax=Botrytis porri TaxID=87229 RepID=UPI0018FF2F64|nr:uncharacterized protein EAF01_002271 [Botrytis porri]KAF7910762.1 hypothetical protein EAF01_002271 [Botrytis porri]